MEKGRPKPISRRESVIDEARTVDRHERKADIRSTTKVKVRGSKAVLEDRESVPEFLEELDSHGVSEALEFMELDNPIEIVGYRPEEDEESEDVQRPFRDPAHIVGRVTKSRVRSREREINGETEQKPRSCWFITTCVYCGNIFRFRSDQPQPPTCGRPECIMRFEQRVREKGVGSMRSARR
jgi:hypothetical protein